MKRRRRWRSQKEIDFEKFASFGFQGLPFLRLGWIIQDSFILLRLFIYLLIHSSVCSLSIYSSNSFMIRIIFFPYVSFFSLYSSFHIHLIHLFIIQQFISLFTHWLFYSSTKYFIHSFIILYVHSSLYSSISFTQLIIHQRLFLITMNILIFKSKYIKQRTEFYIKWYDLNAHGRPVIMSIFAYYFCVC